MRSALALFSAALASFALASPHGHGADHAGLAKRLANAAPETEIERRQVYTNARFTWYPTDTGPDACTGKNHNDNDWYVALNMPLFGYSGTGNGHCGQQIKITAKGKSTVATIVDACATCPEDSQIDLTKGLFEFFDGNLGDGVFYGTWEFLDGSDSGGDNNDKPAPKPSPQVTHHSSTPKPTPTPTPAKIKKTTSTTSTTKSTSTTHSTSSSSKTTSKSTSTTSTTSSTTSTSTSTTTTTTSSTPTPTNTDVAGNAGSDPNHDIQGGIGTGSDSDTSSATTRFAGGFVSLLAFIVVQVAVF